MEATDALQPGRFEGPQAFADRVRSALQAAAVAGWREMVWSDPDFEDWPLRERAVAEHLNAWMFAGGHMTLLAYDYRPVQRHHARFVEWRVRWDHRISCRQCRSVDRGDIPSVLWSPQWALRRLDLQHCSGAVETDARSVLRCRESLDELLRRSSPGFAASTLGL